MEVMAVDVARFILDQTGTRMTTMKLQKLVFYSHAWHLAWTGDPLVTEGKFQAWKNGPVSYELFEAHRGKFSIFKTELTQGNTAAIPNESKEVIKLVLNSYGELSGAQLSELTHAEDPWLEVRNDFEAGIVQSQEIVNKRIMDFYQSLISTGKDISSINWDSK